MTESRILIVDDEAPIRRIMLRILTKAGYACEEVSSAQEARARLDRFSYELVLCDVNMPGESGLSLAEHVLANRTGTAVVMVTGVDDTTIAHAALESGAYGYVIKPFEHNEILINVANALRRRALEIENRDHANRLEAMVAERTAGMTDALREIAVAERALRASQEEAIQRLALAAEFRDPHTGVHLKRISRYASMLAERAGLERQQRILIRLASPMHDIGKIGVPDGILRKPGSLDESEWAIMRKHPEMGFEILADSDSEMVQLAAKIALTHHERFDGGGYPYGIAGERIPVEGRIVAIADVFDALTSVRPYKPAFSLDKALSIMRSERGRHFDPELLDLFLSSIRDVERILADNDSSAATVVA